MPLERRLGRAAGIAIACALSAGLGSAHAADPSSATKRRPAASRAVEDVPKPYRVQSRSRPLKQDRTALVPFDTAPFPYRGAGPGRASADQEDGERQQREDKTHSDPRVLLHIPKGFDIRRPAVMIVFFHGHGATLQRDVLRRQRVAAQISESNVNAVLVAPQFAVNARDSSPGRFWQPGAFGRFLGEAAQNLAKLHGDPRSVRSFTTLPVVLIAYSGGYMPAAWCIANGGIKKRLHGVVLLDALYGEVGKFARWVEGNPSAFFVSTYLGRSTTANNESLRKILAERNVTTSDEIAPELGTKRRGGVTILRSDSGTTHRDLVTRAWADEPITDLLNRLRRFPR